MPSEVPRKITRCGQGTGSERHPRDPNSNHIDNDALSICQSHSELDDTSAHKVSVVHLSSMIVEQHLCIYKTGNAGSYWLIDRDNEKLKTREVVSRATSLIYVAFLLPTLYDHFLHNIPSSSNCFLLLALLEILLVDSEFSSHDGKTRAKGSTFTRPANNVRPIF